MPQDVVTLRDPNGARAAILPGFGCNCFQFQAVVDGETVDVIWSEPEFATGRRRASGSGIPILFPFPGRLPGTRATWGGAQYELPSGDGRGNAIHGFVLNRPWRVLMEADTRLVAQFHAARDDPKILEHWPADFCITVTYELGGAQLSAQFVIDNPGSEPLPYGLGIHPYFSLPLGQDDRRDDCRVVLPVGERWELAELLPTGHRSELADASAYHQGLRFGEMKFDDVFGGLEFRGSRCTAELHDPACHRRVALSFSREFRYCVVYTPPHREAICIEPYSCVPGFPLDSGHPKGLQILAPGASVEAAVEIRVA